MNMVTQRIAAGRTVDEFLGALSHGREIFTLQAGEDKQYHLVRADRWEAGRHTLGAFRQIEPLKSVLFQPREYFGPALNNADQLPEIPERIVIGVKNCDLAGLKIQDHVFNGLPPGDPAYVQAREKTILVSCDCTDCLDACFCPIVGEQPYPEKGFDINLSPLSDSYLVDAGSDRGAQLLEGLAEYLAPVDEKLLAERQQRRAAMTDRLVQQSAGHGLRPGTDLAAAVRGAKDTSMWEDFAQDCVECGACNFVCCTCHCFQLVDGITDGNPARGKQWDGCLLMNFARVAGGANPRAGRAKRLRNRFEKKFDYFPEVLDCYACDGCGRCTEVCPGNIDIRAVLKRAVDETESLHADNSND
jgi:ferredoxin